METKDALNAIVAQSQQLKELVTDLELTKNDLLSKGEYDAQLVESEIVKVQNKCTDMLSLLKAEVTSYKIPEDPAELEEWKKNSHEYTLVACYDELIDVLFRIMKI